MKYLIIYQIEMPPYFITSWNVIEEKKYFNDNIIRIQNEIPISDTVVDICDTLEESYKRRDQIVSKMETYFNIYPSEVSVGKQQQRALD